MKNYKQELQNFLQKWPDIHYIDLIFPDINGTPRGKRVSISAAKKLGSGVYLPASTVTLDVKGEVVEEAGWGQEMGEPDYLCLPITETLTPTVDPKVGQILLTMMDDTGQQPFQLAPRQVLDKLVKTLHQRHQFPVMAVELEFYLLDTQRSPNGDIQLPINPKTCSREINGEVYNLANLDDYSAFLTDVNAAAAQQNLNISGVLAESAPGQFEINFHHQQNILQLCDHVILTKRMIRQIAKNHGYDVTFMAKPFADEAGNGQHVHVSIVDDKNHNLFSQPNGEPSDFFYQSLCANIQIAPQAMALLAPHINSYRRFGLGMLTPTVVNWSHNNRSVALRIPPSTADNRRFEHRIAGADVNPYLLCATVLAGLIYAEKLSAEQCPPAQAENPEALPQRLSEALKALHASEILTDLLGAAFIDTYITCRANELREFDHFVTPKEIEWMLHSA